VANNLSETQAAFINKYIMSIAPANQDSGDTDIPTDTADLTALTAALAKLTKRAQPIIADMPDEQADITAMLFMVRDALNAQDGAEAREQLYFATDYINMLEKRSAELAKLQATMPVSLELCKVNWVDATGTVVDQIADVRTAMLAEIDEDDVGPQSKKLKTLEDEVSKRGQALAQVMTEIMRADVAKRDALIETGRGQVADFRQYLEGSALLKHLIGNPLDNGDSPEHMSVLVKPLNDLDRALGNAKSVAA